jgi:hypothetical protein
VDDAFYEPVDDGSFVASPLTRGPWDEGAQHAGPPSALLARAVEAQLPSDFRLARLSVDILRPIPIARLVPQVTVRQGKRVARAQVVLSAEADGTELINGTAVAQRVADLDLAPNDHDGGPALAPPEGGDAAPFFAVPWDEGYHTAMEWRFVAGSWTALGPAQVWMRQRVPLVAGEEPSPAQRTLVVADAGNGVSAAVDFPRYTFVNSDLTVHLHRDPVGEWIGMDAHTTVQPTGAGLATTILHDRAGPVGIGNQTLLVAPYG